MTATTMLMKIEALPEEYVADEHYFTIGEKLWN